MPPDSAVGFLTVACRSCRHGLGCQGLRHFHYVPDYPTWGVWETSSPHPPGMHWVEGRGSPGHMGNTPASRGSPSGSSPAVLGVGVPWDQGDSHPSGECITVLHQT